MIVLIDNGHGANTPGKCSPDKQIREYSYAREIASLLEQNAFEQNVFANIVSELFDGAKSRFKANNFKNKLLWQIEVEEQSL